MMGYTAYLTLEWFFETGVRTLEEIVENSTKWGNRFHTNSPRKVLETGSRDEWCTNNVYDFAGNVDEWLYEPNVLFGAFYDCDSSMYPACYYSFLDYSYQSGHTGFRTVLVFQ